ncbi:ABC transporter permease [Thiomicrorhabdus xiamenensis]|uniref:ABC transporter permease n=1 Tax=Thiomicrorhabdus xiamenensis TaxID=2739063 RepID=A0A7D4NQU8_9GAMM|nr:ABC transporter permease [Thiomicrorhabdus xiamenensis]QKI89050.1 ABC transporter permease [Thiomicrorhabdus xiamenensis]
MAWLSWARIWALTIKEFRVLLQDKRARFVVIGPPMIQLFVFGYAATFDLKQAPVAIFNQDQGIISQEIIGHLAGSDTFEIVAQLHHQREVAPLIDNREALIVLNFPSDFSSRLQETGTTQLQVIVDGRNSNTALLAQNDVMQVIKTFNEQWAQAHQLNQAPVSLVQRNWFNENLKSNWFFVPGIVALIVLVVSLLVTALSVAREREEGTFDQLLVTPAVPLEILIGKSLPGLMIGLLESNIIILIAVFWFGVPFRGEYFLLQFALIFFLLSAIGVGLMISALSTTQQQALLGAFMFMVPAVILSGFATPIDNMPDVIQWLTYVDPLRYFLVVVRGVFLQDLSLETLWPQIWPMMLIALFTLSSAAWLFRHRSA